MATGLLDRDFLHELIDGDREFGAELLSTFEEASGHWLKVARDACDSADATEAVRAFHTLKGSAASVGLLDLREAALTLERLAKEGDVESCAAGLDALQNHVMEGRGLLRDFLRGLP